MSRIVADAPPEVGAFRELSAAFRDEHVEPVRVDTFAASSALSEYSLKLRSAKNAGIETNGFGEVLAALQAFSPDEPVVLFHFATLHHGFIVFVRDRDDHLFGCTRVAYRVPRNLWPKSELAQAMHHASGDVASRRAFTVGWLRRRHPALVDAVLVAGDAGRLRALHTAVRLALDASELTGDLATEALAALAAQRGSVELRARLARIEREADTQCIAAFQSWDGGPDTHPAHADGLFFRARSVAAARLAIDARDAEDSVAAIAEALMASRDEAGAVRAIATSLGSA